MPEELAKSVLVPHILKRYRISLATTSLPTSSRVLLRRCRKQAQLRPGMNFDCLTGMHLHPVRKQVQDSARTFGLAARGSPSLEIGSSVSGLGFRV